MKKEELMEAAAKDLGYASWPEYVQQAPAAACHTLETEILPKYVLLKCKHNIDKFLVAQYQHILAERGSGDLLTRYTKMVMEHNKMIPYPCDI